MTKQNLKAKKLTSFLIFFGDGWKFIENVGESRPQLRSGRPRFRTDYLWMVYDPVEPYFYWNKSKTLQKHNKFVNTIWKWIKTTYIYYFIEVRQEYNLNIDYPTARILT